MIIVIVDSSADYLLINWLIVWFVKNFTMLILVQPIDQTSKLLKQEKHQIFTFEKLKPWNVFTWKMTIDDCQSSCQLIESDLLL